jgi:hypothetical protein
VVGDKHIVGAAPSGDFADHADDLAVLTSRGWEFAAPAVGQQVYVLALDEFRYWSEAGEWAQGGVTDGSIGAKHLQFPFGMAVEDELDTPPGGTPAEGTKWIVAANATGAWDDWDGDVAEADGAGGFRRLSAYHGATVASKALNTLRTFNGDTGEWTSAGGAWLDQKSSFQQDNSTGASNAGSGIYGYSHNTAPANQLRRIQATLNHQARATGAKLRITFSGTLTTQNGVGASGGDVSGAVVALYRDAVTNAIAWNMSAADMVTIATDSVNVTFYIDAPDAAVHNYTIAIMSGRNSNTELRMHAGHRLMTIEEAA